MKTEQAGKSEDHSSGKNADREILSLALPAAGAAFTALAHTWVDTAWIGRSEDGALGLAALGIASFTVSIYRSADPPGGNACRSRVAPDSLTTTRTRAQLRTV